MLRAISLAGFLLAFWAFLSGYLEPFLLAAGVGSSIAVVLLVRRMDVLDHEGQPIHLGLGIVFYGFWLVTEILKSGLAVSKIILDPRLPISPTLVRFPPSQKTDVGLVIHANSITLTPGTISVEVRPQEFVVHALTAAGAEGVKASEMDARVARMERLP